MNDTGGVTVADPDDQSLFAAPCGRSGGGAALTGDLEAAILTLLPLAFALGRGSGMQQPLAVAIIAGLAVEFPLVLLAVPALIGLTLPRETAPEPI